MSAESIRLFTRQNEKTLLMLEKEDRIINRRLYVQLHFGDMAPHYMQCYDWFSQQAALRVPRPVGVSLPIWCALKPDTCLTPLPGTVVYILDVPREQVVFYDDGKWDYVLNHRYLPASAQDEQAYIQRLQTLGLNSSYEFFEGRYAGKFPDEIRRITDSWQRVFDVPDLSADSVCGNIWEIRRESLAAIVRPGQDVFAAAQAAPAPGR